MKKENLPYVLLFLIALLSILIVNPGELTSSFNLFNLISHVIYVSLYFFILPSIFQEEVGIFFQFLRFFSFIGFITALIGLVFLRFGSWFSSYHEQLYPGIFLSYIVNPMYVSFLLTNTILISLYLYLNFRGSLSLFKKYTLLLSLSLQLLAQVLTLCRGGLIGTVIGIVILFTFYFRGKFIFVLPFLAIFGSGAAVTYFKIKGFASFVTRFFLLIPAYHMLKDSFVNFLWGYGPTNQYVVYKKYILFYIPYQAVESPHNTIISLIFMYGFIFALIFFGFYFQQLVKGAKIIFRKSLNNELKMMVGFLVSNSFALFVQGQFDSSLMYFIFFDIQFFLLYFGFLAIVNRNPEIFNSRFQNFESLGRYEK